MNRKLLKHQIYLRTVIILGIIIVLVLIVNQFSLRLDLTQGQQYSLSKTSKNLLKNLDDIVNIKVYFSNELPNYLLATRQEVEDLLKEYQNYAGSKLKITYIDPASSPDLEKEVQAIRIPKLQFNVLENDKYQVTNGYLGIAVMYGDKSEVLPVVQNSKNFEYDLTSAIKKVSTKEQLQAAFTTGHGEKTLNDLTSALQQQYQLQTVDLSSGALIPDSIKTLIIAGPTQPFDDRSLFVIDQFVMNGGGLLVLSDKINVDNNLRAQPVNNNLDNLLLSYGLKVNNDLVEDLSNEMANFSQGYVQFIIPYPMWVKVTKNGFDKNNVIVNQLEGLVLPWTSSVEYIGTTDKREVSYLAKSTDKAWLQTGTFNLDPQKQEQSFNPQTQGQKNLAIAVFGAFDSFFKGKTVPPAKEAQNMDENFQEQTDYARLVVMGDADFTADGFIKNMAGNQVYIQNLIDGLSQSADLISIRSKTITDRGLKQLSDNRRNFIKYGLIFGPTFLVVVYGLLRFVRRRKKSFVDEL